MSCKICVAGASGKMGQEILRLIGETKGAEVVQTFGRSVQIFSDKKPNVMIDFTLPVFFDESLNFAIKNKIAFVSGTTGLTDVQFKKLEKASKAIPVLWASNMSLGVCALKQMLKVFSALDEYDFYIEETHHGMKKDSPSGTAITLQKNLEKAIGKKTKSVFALRGGGVVGQHRVVALGPEETIVLQHDALSRGVFARGAIACAKWIYRKKKGSYSIEDVLYK